MICDRRFRTVLEIFSLRNPLFFVAQSEEGFCAIELGGEVVWFDLERFFDVAERHQVIALLQVEGAECLQIVGALWR